MPYLYENLKKDGYENVITYNGQNNSFDSKKILDDFLFKGKFTSTKLDFREANKQNKYTVTPITINTILKGKENDSVWIIDNVRDSIAHGHYYIDFNDNSIVANYRQICQGG